MQFHIDAPPAERHAFHFKPQALIQRRVSAQLDLATRAENPVPGQTARSTQGPRYQPRSARMSGCFCDRSIRGNVSAGHFLDRSDDTITHLDFSVLRNLVIFAQPVIATCDALTV
jgi:hypothetical protein